MPGAIHPPNYGIIRWGDLFNPRQKLALITFAEKVRQAHAHLLAQGAEPEFAKAVATYLALVVDELARFTLFGPQPLESQMPKLCSCFWQASTTYALGLLRKRSCRLARWNMGAPELTEIIAVAEALYVHETSSAHLSGIPAVEGERWLVKVRKALIHRAGDGRRGSATALPSRDSIGTIKARE
jgi:hypothetical protein